MKLEQRDAQTGEVLATTERLMDDNGDEYILATVTETGEQRTFEIDLLSPAVAQYRAFEWLDDTIG
tara:strand:+ start:550 stop:747 length:198 start_codon:yes stop_codon:yes gene_type:complete